MLHPLSVMFDVSRAPPPAAPPSNSCHLSSLSLFITLFSSDTDKNNSELRLTLLSRAQIIQQRLWFHSGTFLGGCFVVCELRRNPTWRSQLVFSLFLVSAGSKAWQHQTGTGKSRQTLSFCIHIVAVHWMRGGTVSWKVNTFRRTCTHVQCRHYQCNTWLATTDRAALRAGGSCDSVAHHWHVSWMSHGEM